MRRGEGGAVLVANFNEDYKVWFNDGTYADSHCSKLVIHVRLCASNLPPSLCT